MQHLLHCFCGFLEVNGVILNFPICNICFAVVEKKTFYLTRFTRGLNQLYHLTGSLLNSNMMNKSS